MLVSMFFCSNDNREWAYVLRGVVLVTQIDGIGDTSPPRGGELDRGHEYVFEVLVERK